MTTPFHEGSVKIGRMRIISTGWFLILQLGDLQRPIILDDMQVDRLVDHLTLKQAARDWT